MDQSEHIIGPGGHFEFSIGTNFTNLVKDQLLNISVWLKSVQWFQRRRSKCEKLTDDDADADADADDGRKVMTKAHMAF